MSVELGVHQGKPVLAASVKITRAGDGLSKPLAAMPRGFDSGTRMPVMLWVEVGDDTFKPVKADADGPVIGFTVKYNFIAEEAIVLDHVDHSTLDAMFATQREAVADWEREQARLKKEAEGVHELELDKPEGDGAGMTEAEWMDEAAATAPTPIGSRRKRGAKAKDAE